MCERTNTWIKMNLLGNGWCEECNKGRMDTRLWDETTTKSRTPYARIMKAWLNVSINKILNELMIKAPEVLTTLFLTRSDLLATRMIAVSPPRFMLPSKESMIKWEVKPMKTFGSWTPLLWWWNFWGVWVAYLPVKRKMLFQDRIH